MAERKNAMANAHKTQVAVYGTPISRAEYGELRDYAEACGIRLSGFKNYVGDIEVIKTIIDDIIEISVDFPMIVDERNGIVLHLDFDMKEGDFATTDSFLGHEILLNAGYFSDVNVLEEKYAEEERVGRFVKGTNWRSVIRHEVGHIVAHLYRFDIIRMAEDIFGTKSRLEILDKLTDNLSTYAAEYYDCREVISESFSAYYSKIGNEFADIFVAKCIKEARKSDLSMKGR